MALSVAGTVSAPIAYVYTDGSAAAKPPAAQSQARASFSAPAAVVPAAAVPAGQLHGIDVSYAETMSIDWDEVKKRDLARFVISRASYASYAADDDPNFIRNHDACKRLAIPFGAYHFLVFWEPGAAQARHFLQRIDGYTGTLCPAVDVEELSGKAGTVQDRLKILAAFIDTVERALGTTMIIYTDQDAWNTLMGGSDSFAGHRLWIANPNDDPNRPPAMPTGFPDWTIYQYSWTGKLPLLGGGTHDVDVDVLKGDIASIALRQESPSASVSAVPAPRAPRTVSESAPLSRVVYDGIDHKLKVFDTNGAPIFVCDAKNETVADNGWRPDAGCPPGNYVLAGPLANDPDQPLSDRNNWKGEGRWFVPIDDIPGHIGIGIHGGGSCVTPPLSNALLPRQGWCRTENCIRVQNEDLETFVRFPLAGKPIHVVQSAAP
jgi:GH25 family lysozyme M1 (1,4-beta-N-acetylmuramidase)